MTDITPLNQNFPVTDQQGYFTPSFKRYQDLLLARVGGITGGSYGQLVVNTGAIFWDLNQNPNSEITLVNGATTMDVPINLVAGLVYRLVLVQPSSGAAGTITWPDPPFRFAGGTPPTLSLANNAIDYMQFFCDGTNIFNTVFGKNYS